MKNIDGVINYTIREAGFYLGLSSQTLYNYLRYSNILVSQGKKPLIPMPTVIKSTKYFSEKQIDIIRDVKRHIKKGDFLEFRRGKTNYQKLIEENKKLKIMLKELNGGVSNT